jgi:hypothetical protein
MYIADMAVENVAITIITLKKTLRFGIAASVIAMTKGDPFKSKLVVLPRRRMSVYGTRNPVVVVNMILRGINIQKT